MSSKFFVMHGKLCVVMVLTAVLALLSGEMCRAWAAKISQTYSPKQNELWIKIDKTKLKLTLRRGDGEILKSYPVAIGRGKGVKKSRTDLITPAGVFTIWRVIQDATQLVYDPKWFGEPGEPQKGAYGSKLISFYNPWEIALHGTDSPKSIGRAVTHGCIRMYNKDIVELSKSVKPGMRLWIVEKDEPTVEYDTI
ncbi:MAG: L,D-transpeptidase [Synergistaceae bacterium]|nr:L,D-transpeptidase [Synergistaceae bacterium]